MSPGFPSGGERAPRSLRPVVLASDDREKLLARLGPLLHEMIAHDLVTRSPSGRLVLDDDVGRHLEDIWEKRNQRVAQVFIGRSCTTCRRVTATRLVDGVQRCDACRTAALDPAPPATDSSPSDSERHRSRLRRTRRAS